MSIAPATGQSGLPSVNETLEPEWVRHGSQATQKAYETALSFEQTLVEQLSKSLAATTESEGEGSGEGESGGGSAATSQLSSTLPQALSSGIMNAGGLGLAAQLTRDLPGAEATKAASTSGGVSA
jgi:Rod binding domain-containing protein